MIMRFTGRKRAAVFLAVCAVAVCAACFAISAAVRQDPASGRQPYSFQPLAPLSGEAVMTAQITEDIRQTVYRTGAGAGYPYGAYISMGGCDYYLGSSLADNLLLSETPLAPVEGEAPVFMWSETRGAAYGCTRFMTVRDGEPVYLLDMDGYPVFCDLDGDGRSEIIAVSPGVVSVTRVWFWGRFDEGAGSVSVNDALKADSVYYENGMFIARTGENADEAYIYRQGRFEKIRE